MTKVMFQHEQPVENKTFKSILKSFDPFNINQIGKTY